MAAIPYSILEAGKCVLFKDAAETAETSPIAAGETNTPLVPHATTRALVVTNPANSTGAVTVKIGTDATPDDGSFTLGVGDSIRLPIGSVNKAATGTAYPNRIFITTAASTTASFMFEVDSPDGT